MAVTLHSFDDKPSIRYVTDWVHQVNVFHIGGFYSIITRLLTNGDLHTKCKLQLIDFARSLHERDDVHIATLATLRITTCTFSPRKFRPCSRADT